MAPSPLTDSALPIPNRTTSPNGDPRMDRRDFLKTASASVGGLILPIYGHAIAAEALTTKVDVALKKKLADIALNAATKAGASYCDVRIGRYLRQFVITRETKV